MTEKRDKSAEAAGMELDEPAGPIGQAMPEVRRRLAKHKARLDALPAPAAPNRTAPGPAGSAVLLRGVAFNDPAQQSLLGRCGSSAPQLDIASPPERLPEEGTEQLLNDLIGECHFLMREVAFRSMCQTSALEDRMRWVDRAMDLAKTGAHVAKAVARLRHGSQVKETRHTLNVENNVAAAAGGI